MRRTPLLPEEVLKAFKIKVREVSVFGEPPLQESAPQNQLLGQFFQPSRAFPGSSGLRVSNYEDGPTMLYVARFEGDAAALLGRTKTLGENRVLLKIGVTNDTETREKQLNAGFPPASLGMWSMRLRSEPFPNRKAAEVAEEKFKSEGPQSLTSLGGEFFLGNWADAQLLFARIPGVARFGN